jgi:hypothetical protein
MGSPAVADPLFVSYRPIHSYPVTAAGHSEISLDNHLHLLLLVSDPTPDIDPCRHLAGPNRGYWTLHTSALGHRRPRLLSSFEFYWNRIHLPTLIANFESF